jgi:hypothetical protein
MSRPKCKSGIASYAVLLLILLAMVMAPLSCRKPESAFAAKETPRTFASPAEAAAAFFEAAKSGDRTALIAIFGPGGEDVLFTGDPVKDKDALNNFVSAYQTMNRWVDIEAGGKLLYIGAENFPFPIPLRKNSSGWYFDSAAGADEILARRIGRDELVAIAALGALANAEQQYFQQIWPGEKVQQYAQKFASDEGKRNGLYWPVAEGYGVPSPLGQMGDFAKMAGFMKPGEKPQPFNGYIFRILTKQGSAAKGGAKDYLVNGDMTGGFAFAAYPAEYRNSGIMSFIVGEDGIIYEKDLGEHTTDVAAAMTEFNPGKGWSPVTE